MGHVVRDTGRWEIDIDTTKGYIFLHTRWKYVWLTSGAVTNWTYAERKKFHEQVDRNVWRAWSHRAQLRVLGNTPFCKQFQGRDIRLDLDVKWVTSNGHWQVEVTKVAPGTFVRSEVFWNAKKIQLDTEDVKTANKCNDVPSAVTEDLYRALPGWAADHATVKALLTQNVCRQQVPAAHEFSHVAGNTAVLSRGDEYRRSSPHVRDVASIVNIGSELRTRHFQTIVDELNTMIPGCTFFVQSVRN